MAEYRQLRVLARRVTAQELAKAEDETSVEEGQVRKANGQASCFPTVEVRTQPGLLVQ